MQPNNVLDFRRFGFYLRQHLLASWKSYMLGTLAILGIMLLFPLFILVTGNIPNRMTDLVGFYYVGLFFAGMLFTSMSFTDFINKEKGVHFLMLPASLFEKYISMFLITSIGFLLVYNLCASIGFFAIDNVVRSKTGMGLARNWEFFNTKNGAIYFYYGYVFLHAVFLLGAISFQRLAFFKTFVTTLLILGGLYLLNTIFVWILFGNKMYYPFQQVPFLLVATKGGVYNSEMFIISEKMIKSYAFIAEYVLAPVLWTIAYFRLKDKEI
ncbi:hypothetical protein [Chitinophaga flava]|uniref:Uncharacterized protein n=1 Tax=Chitinophaga flava TaxID=2259036 RepID=A0A365Y335_9BACT|nr:hypothetical protein [Chitinophaga flava]RBL92930.1 hypothetical protein DF182_10245 [Chitinophaga flava]